MIIGGMIVVAGTIMMIDTVNIDTDHGRPEENMNRGGERNHSAH